MNKNKRIALMHCYFNYRKTVVFMLIAGMLLACISANAQYTQYPNVEKNILQPLRKIADSVLLTADSIASPQYAKTYLQKREIKIQPIKFQIAGNIGKSFSSTVIYNNDKPAVGIFAMCVKPFNPLHNDVKISPASTFVISPDGVCVTNFHVVYAYANSLKQGEKGLCLVRLGNDSVYPLKTILAVSSKDDIALIQLDTKGQQLPFLKLSEADASIGDDIYVLGNPTGLMYNFTKGIVSDKYNETFALPGEEGFAERNVMAITAEFAVGSSGSPVLDSSGSVTGIVSSTIVIEQSNTGHPQTQMVVRNIIPVSSIKKLIHSVTTSNNK